jgi:hypothetical protein
MSQPLDIRRGTTRLIGVALVGGGLAYYAYQMAGFRKLELFGALLLLPIIYVAFSWIVSGYKGDHRP